MALLQEIKVPLLAVNDTTLTVAELSYASGTGVKKGDVILVFETSKTTYEFATETEGFIQYLCMTGQDYEVDTVIARIYSDVAEAAATIPIAMTLPPGAGTSAAGMPVARPHAGAAHTAPTAAQSDPWSGETPSDWEGEAVFSHDAEQLIGKHGLDRSLFRGMDFVSVSDVVNVLRPRAAVEPNRPKQTLPVDPARAIVEPLSSGKKREIEYLGDIQSTGLTSTIHTFVDTEGIFVHINRSLKYLKDSLLPIVLYEASRLLADHPHLNAYFTKNGIAFYKEVNPGFAIDIGKGLKVLRIGDANVRSIGEIETAILTLSGSYLDDNLRLEDLTDITFTVTDLSSEAVAFFKPLINKMNSAILGISAIDGKMQRCTLSLTFDHRVTEGKEAARFLGQLKQRLESYRAEGGMATGEIVCFKCLKTLAEDLGGTGFVRCITPSGKEGLICQSCIKGF